MRTTTETGTAAPLVPARPTLRSLKRAAAACRACDLWRKGRQTVFGEGPADAQVVFVGEQPGDREDLAGKPFVGPAGRILDRALDQAGRPWLDAELELLSPVAVVALGATAAKSLIARDFLVSERRGEILPFGERVIMATMHPSSILRAPDEEARRVAFKALVADPKKLEPLLNP